VREARQAKDWAQYWPALGLDGKVLAHGQREDLVGEILIDARPSVAPRPPIEPQSSSTTSPVNNQSVDETADGRRVITTAICEKKHVACALTFMKITAI
jgi:hypothetical protein